MALPLIPWMGGKRRLASRLLPLFPEHTCYVEPFCGAAALFFLRPQPAKVEVLNDINGELINLYRCVQHHLDEFVRQFRWSLASRQIFDWAKQAAPVTLTDIQRAARFFFLQKMAFGARVAGQTFGTATTAPARWNLVRIEEELSEAHLRLNGVCIEHKGWEDCLRTYDRPHTFFYLDPPYWGTEGYGVAFPLEQYERLASALRRLAGKALLSVNDCPEMRAAFAGLHQSRVSISYTVGRKAESRRPVSELVVSNYVP